MRWNEVLAQLSVKASGGAGDPDISDVTCDSRKVAPGSMYVSIPGLKLHGDSFIADAIARGASAILSENPHPAGTIPWAQAAGLRQTLGILSRAVHGIDISQTLFIGITGTNGKTTTAYLFERLMSLVFGTTAVWMFGTIKYSTGGAEAAAQRTTPESSDIFRSMRRAAARPKAVVMEVSSHALALDRVAGLSFDCAIFTNLTQDHLDFHKSMEAYYKAKKRLFTDYSGGRRGTVINIDDPWGRRLASELSGNNKVTYGTSDEALVRIVGSESTGSATTIECRIGEVHERFTSRLAGKFNVYNMTALVAGALSLSIDMREVRQCFDTIETVPGRMERVDVGADFSVFVDYAHTPDALENVCATARNLTGRRLLCVFGAGGDRDTTKRPLMAGAVARYCDEAIVTSDNPRGEKPETIIRDVVRGLPLDFPQTIILDRKEAIRKALNMAQKGDCIIIAGKGHENYQEIQGVRHHFDDREAVVEAYAEVRKNNAARTS
jgi:UDP-N-acetylmuramoyl-L-alanyl-D-glutamate--2,6-diaminopimelate ligase